ncbi:MAG: hypothetical protein ACMUIS_00840 [bacterium]
MSCPRGWKRIFFVIAAISPFLFFLTQVNAATLQPPRICDVTTKMFSVVWTTGGTYTSCGIKLYTDGSHSTEVALNPNQIIIDTAAGQSGEDGKDFGIAKVSVVGLDYSTTYYFGVTQNSGTPFHYSQVTTESLRGLASNDPNDHDIVSNDVLHKAVYKADGTSPALGAVVLADIYDSTGTTPLSDYPVSAWVGDGLPGGASTTYDPNNPSYKHYALIEMNNLFGGSASGDNYKFPLQLQGAEMIRFTIVCGAQAILGKGADDFVVSWGRVESIDKVNGEPIMMPMVSASFRFAQGLNMFTLPFDAPDGYTTKNLFEAIEAAHGGATIVTAIYKYQNGFWTPTQRSLGKIVPDNITLDAGDACFVQMSSSMTNEIIFYGKPNSLKINLVNNRLNAVAIPQIPAYYMTKNFFLDIEAPAPVGGGAGTAKVINVWYYDATNKIWKPTTRSLGQITPQALPMSNTKFYFVQLTSDANNVANWDPFSAE